MSIQGKNALVTGGGSGIGFSFAQLLYARGCNVCLIGRSRDKLQHASQRLRQSALPAASEAPRILTLALDLAHPDSPEEVFRYCRREAYEVDILINNAGVGAYGMHARLAPQESERMLALNVCALASLCRLFGAEMAPRGAGHILNVASTAAFQPLPRLAAYAASKSFVLNFSEAFAMEMEDFGVTVTCLSPGQTESGFFARAGIDDSKTGFFDRRKHMDADTVAAVGLKAMFENRLSVVPGLRNRLLAFSSRLAPRTWVARMAKGATANS